jgi:hypothetical protein
VSTETFGAPDAVTSSSRCYACPAQCWSGRRAQQLRLRDHNRGLNAVALCVFGLPLMCLALAVALYQIFWGGGGELVMLGVVAGVLAGTVGLLRPWRNEFIDLMSNVYSDQRPTIQTAQLKET